MTPKTQTHDAPVADPAEQPGAFNDVATGEIERPTTGRIVHLNVGGYGAPPTLRPAVITATGVLDHDDAIEAVVFLSASDFPLRPGVNIRNPDVGSPAYPRMLGWVVEAARYGNLPGQWRWPERLDPQFFTV